MEHLTGSRLGSAHGNGPKWLHSRTAGVTGACPSLVLMGCIEVVRQLFCFSFIPLRWCFRSDPNCKSHGELQVLKLGNINAYYACGRVPFLGSPSQPQLACVQGMRISQPAPLGCVRLACVLCSCTECLEKCYPSQFGAWISREASVPQGAQELQTVCSWVRVPALAHQVLHHGPPHHHHILPAEFLSFAPLPEVLQIFRDANGHWRFLLPSFLRWLSSDLCTRKHSFKFWARILGFRISSPIELGNQPLSWS